MSQLSNNLYFSKLFYKICMGQPNFFVILPLPVIKQKNIDLVDFSVIWARISRAEGEQVDH